MYVSLYNNATLAIEGEGYLWAGSTVTNTYENIYHKLLFKNTEKEKASERSKNGATVVLSVFLGSLLRCNVPTHPAQHEVHVVSIDRKQQRTKHHK